MSAKCRARVQVTLDVDAGSVWGGDCPLEQVYSQARKDAERTLTTALAKMDVRVIGPMKITAVLAQESE